MDLYRFFKLRVYNHTKFTLHISVIIILIHFFLLLVNGILKGNFFYYIDPELLLSGVTEIYLHQENDKFWAPEAITIAIFTLLVIWGITIVWYWLINIYKWISSPCKWESKNGFPQDCFNDIIYQGQIKRRTDNAIFLTNSGAGILLKNMFWKNFTIEFKFNFESLRPTLEKDYLRPEAGEYREWLHKPESNFIGFIFRALDLDNYFMISIGIKQKLINDKVPEDGGNNYEKKLLITPHIKVDGKWEVFTRGREEEVNLGSLKIDDFNIVVCEVKDRLLVLTLKNKNRIVVNNYKWNLPSNFSPTYIDKNQVREKGEEYSYGDSSQIPFVNSFGMIGFRTYGDEHAVIKDIVITKLC